MGSYAGRLTQIIRNDYASTACNTTAWITLTTSLREDCRQVEIFDSSSSEFVLGYGVAGGEQTACRVLPGGNGNISLLLNKGMRIALKCANTTISTASTGVFVMNCYV